MKAKVLIAALFCLGFVSKTSNAQNKGVELAAYTLEITPLIGINLPYDLWGATGTLNVLGVQSALSINEAGAISVGALYHYKTNDTAYTFDAGYRHEIKSLMFNAFFDIGLHYSQFNLEIDYDSDNNCIPANCLTDSGSHSGIYAGTGLIIPLAPMTLIRLGFRFYSNPQSWVMINAGLGIRL